MSSNSRIVATWGLADLEACIGPVARGRLYSVGARPSNGKSTFLLNWVNWIYANAAESSVKTLCLWTERSPGVAYGCWAALRLGLDQDLVLLHQWEMLPPEAKAHVRAEIKALQYYSDKIIFHEQSRCTTKGVMELLDHYQPDILVLDYIQRAKPEAGQNKFQAIAEMATSLQEAAVQREIAVVVSAQLKRGGEGVFSKYRPPSEEDFKMAGEIEEVSDVALGLFRPLRKVTAMQERQIRHGELDLEDFKVPNTMSVKCLKHRYRAAAADQVVRLHCENSRVEDMRPEHFIPDPTDPEVPF